MKNAELIYTIIHRYLNDNLCLFERYRDLKYFKDWGYITEKEHRYLRRFAELTAGYKITTV